MFQATSLVKITLTVSTILIPVIAYVKGDYGTPIPTRLVGMREPDVCDVNPCLSSLPNNWDPYVSPFCLLYYILLVFNFRPS